ncbi:MAG: dihydroneopterin aldolase [Sediminibacterium sp.]|jgi:dihydroneopterin aldolase|nr:dihydroneopterin aldolase [Chitinophagaceae bacterium]
MKIILKDLRFFGYHGLYDTEKKAGTYFTVNLIAIYSTDKPILQIEETVNYAELFALVKAEMETATPLLETLAQRIATHILARFSLVETVHITIEKESPPIPYFNGSSVGIEWEQKRVP